MTAPSQPTTGSGRPLILMIDDQPSNLHVLAAALKADYRLRVATDGPGGLALARQDERPRLILLDVMMPGMSGIEVLRELRAAPDTADIPVILVTADASEQTQLDALELGADDYLHKPVVARALLARVRNLLLRRAAEEESRRLNVELEARVRERTAELETLNQELVAARDTALAANRAKSLFLANMSHELRTPLNAILGFAQLMVHDERIPEDQRHNLAIVNRSGQHLLALINDVLEIARIESGRIERIERPFDLFDLLDSIVEVMALRAETKGLALRLERAAGLPRQVTGDLGKLRQILLNLLSNAVKYTPHGGVTLSVEAAATGDDRVEIRFTVEDSGVGISAAELERIFQPFYQTAHGVALGEGTGLGLAISREYAELLGGQLDAESTPGAGSRFRLRLPLAISATTGAGGEPRRILGLAAGEPSRRILVAEDHPDNQALITAILEQAGFQCRVAGDGHEAVALFQTWSPHLVLMDMRMPGMDGYAASRAIRALPNGDRTPIVALTASAFAEEQPEILAAGCIDIIRKPVEADVLLERIGRLLGLAYRYEQSESVAGTPRLDALPALPDDARREALRAAAIELDSQKVLAIAADLAVDWPALSEAITACARGYRFDRILELCERTAP